MSTKHHIPPAHNGQNHEAFEQAFCSPNSNNRIFDDWLQQTETAIDALFVWKSWLRAWKSHPQTGQLPDDLFMAVIQDMNRAGIMSWLDRPELDQLRQFVTGGEQ